MVSPPMKNPRSAVECQISTITPTESDTDTYPLPERAWDQRYPTHPCKQIEKQTSVKNITFPQLLLRTVKRKFMNSV